MKTIIKDSLLVFPELLAVSLMLAAFALCYL